MHTGAAEGLLLNYLSLEAASPPAASLKTFTTLSPSACNWRSVTFRSRAFHAV